MWRDLVSIKSNSNMFLLVMSHSSSALVITSLFEGHSLVSVSDIEDLEF